MNYRELLARQKRERQEWARAAIAEHGTFRRAAELTGISNGQLHRLLRKPGPARRRGNAAWQALAH